MRMLTALDRTLGMLVVASNNVGSLLIFAMMLAVVADVTGRYLFNSPIDGTAEMVTMAVVAVLYLQLSYTLRSGRLTRSEAFHARLAARLPRLANGLGLIFHAAGAGVAAAIIVGGWPRFLAAWHGGYFVGVIDVFSFPEWPLLLIILFGCGLLGLQFLVLATGNLLRVCGGPAHRGESR